MSLTETIGFALGAWCVWLIVKEHIWNWPVGIAQCAFYIIVFWSAGLYADALLQVVYIALGVLGWYWWLHGGSDRSALQVAHVPAIALLPLAAVSAVGTALLAAALAHVTDSTVPFWDALTTVLSLVAQFMLSRKWLENWYVWIAADVVYVGLYLYKGLFLTTALYVGFMALCIAGVLRWRRALTGSQKESRAAAAGL
ncbi:MAG TPA: nicotinamide riboside transporter PnuC [Gammaproteobacteria bacterium]|nr:nicotinamide riboside transporter PnuC [Gammaproteobacteria bacterium]